MQIMIAEHDDRRIAERLYTTEHGQRGRPAIDEIADEPHAIARGIELQPIQEAR
jgi:hypothetical protein